MGDLNANVGNSNVNYENVIEKHGLRNTNGELFADLCSKIDFLIRDILFHHKVTWTSPDCVTKNQIDHIDVSDYHQLMVGDICIRVLLHEELYYCIGQSDVKKY